MITPDQYSWSALREYREAGLPPEQAHANAWKFTLAIEIAAALAAFPQDSLNSSEANAALRRLKQFVQQNYGDASPTLTSTVAQLLRGIKSFNLSAFGFGAGISGSNEEQTLKRK